MKKLFVCFLFSVFFLGSPAFAAEDMEILKNELKKMSQTMEALQKKIEAMEKENEDEKEEVQYLSDRVDKTELHTVTDRISFGVEARARSSQHTL